MTTETPMTREVSHSDILEVMKIFFKGRREDGFWQMEHLEEHIRESFPVPVRVVDDAEAALLAALDDLDAVKAELERDRSQVIDTVNALHSEIAGRQWMLEGRGPYEWDDDRYRDEFAAALGVIKAPIEVLRKIGADWSNCPTDPAAIKAARVNDRARAEAAETALAAMTERNKALVGDVARLEACLAVAMGGCDANSGLEHSPISLPHDRGYTFCYACGETLTKAQAKVASSAAVQRRANAGEG